MRHGERKEVAISCKQLKNLVAGKRSRMNSHAKNLLEEAAVALSLGSTWSSESPHKQEPALARESQDLLVPGRIVRNAIRAGRADVVGVVAEGRAQPLDNGEAVGKLLPGQAG